MLMRNVSDKFQDSSVTTNRNVIPINPVTIAPKGSIAYEDQNSSLLTSNGTVWSSVGSFFPGTTLVFRPNYTGNTYDNIFGSWIDLYSKLQTIPAPKSIFMDDSLLPFGDPIIIPPGNWDMSGTLWYHDICSVHAPPPIIFTQILISDGATINGICGFSGPMIISYAGTTGPAITLDTTPSSRHAAIKLEYGAQITTTGTQPFLRLIDGFAEIITNFAAVIFGTTSTTPATVPTLDVAAGTQLIIVLGAQSTLEDNSISGPGSALCVRLIPGCITSIPPVQTLVPTFFITSVYTSPDTYTRSFPPNINDDESVGYKIGDLWIDTSAGNALYIAVLVSTGAAVWRGPI